MRNQSNERTRHWKFKAEKCWSAKVRNTKISRVLAVPKGVYKGIRVSGEPLWWGERQDKMTLINRNQSEAVQQWAIKGLVTVEPWKWRLGSNERRCGSGHWGRKCERRGNPEGIESNAKFVAVTEIARRRRKWNAQSWFMIMYSSGGNRMLETAEGTGLGVYELKQTQWAIQIWKRIERSIVIRGLTLRMKELGSKELGSSKFDTRKTPDTKRIESAASRACLFL